MLVVHNLMPVRIGWIVEDVIEPSVALLVARQQVSRTIHRIVVVPAGAVLLGCVPYGLLGRARDA